MPNKGKAVVGGWRRKSSRILELEVKEKEKGKGRASLTDNFRPFQSLDSGETMKQSSSSLPKRGRKQKRLDDLNVPYLDTSISKQTGEDSKDGNSEPLNGLSPMPEMRLLVAALDMMQRRDTNEIFAEPVDPDEVENYNKIITDPMDFGTMRAKLQEGLYTTLEQFEGDMFLVFRNAMKFNSSNTIYYKEARSMQGLAEAVLHTLKTDPYKLESEFSLTRGRPAKKPYSKAKQSSAPRRRTPRNTGIRIGASSPDGEDSSLPEKEISPPVYWPWSSFCSDTENLASAVYNAPKNLTVNAEAGIRYRQSLLRYIKGLGPTATRLGASKILTTFSQSQISQRLLLPSPPLAPKFDLQNAIFPFTALHTLTANENVSRERNVFLNLNKEASPEILMPPPKESLFGRTTNPDIQNRGKSGNSFYNFSGTTYLRPKPVAIPRKEDSENYEKGPCFLVSHLKVVPTEDLDNPNGKKFTIVDMLEDNRPENDELSLNWRSRLRNFVVKGNAFLKSFDLFPDPPESNASSSSSQGVAKDNDIATLQDLLTHEYTPLTPYDELGVGNNNNDRQKQLSLMDTDHQEPDLSLQL